MTKNIEDIYLVKYLFYYFKTNNLLLFQYYYFNTNTMNII